MLIHISSRLIHFIPHPSFEKLLKHATVLEPISTTYLCFFTLCRSKISPLWMPHILAPVWFLLHQPSAREGSIKKTERRGGGEILLWQMTLIQGFRLEDTAVRTEMNTQLGECANDRAPSRQSCATFVTHMKSISVSRSSSVGSQWVPLLDSPASVLYSNSW